jgi:hypothetical protein
MLPWMGQSRVERKCFLLPDQKTQDSRLNVRESSFGCHLIPDCTAHYCELYLVGSSELRTQCVFVKKLRSLYVT